MAQPLWFRMWSEAKNDAKLDALTDAEFRCWFKLICAASENDPRGEVDTADHELLALELRVSEPVLESALERMKRLRLVTFDGSIAMFPSWEDRQYGKPSATPEATRERQRKSRSKRDSDTVSHPCHAMSRDGHAPTEQKETEREQSRADAREEVSPSKSNLPPCLTSDSWSIDGGEFLSSFAHIAAAYERKYALPMPPKDIGALGESLKRTCPSGCTGKTPERCAQQVIDKIARAHNFSAALRFFESDRRDV